jgi:hypothetical protein
MAPGLPVIAFVLSKDGVAVVMMRLWAILQKNQLGAWWFSHGKSAFPRISPFSGTSQMFSSPDFWHTHRSFRAEWLKFDPLSSDLLCCLMSGRITGPWVDGCQ